MTGPVLYVHVADDGGLLAIDGESGLSAWLTLADLTDRVASLKQRGGAVLLNKEHGSAAANSALAVIAHSGVDVVATDSVHADAVRAGGLTAAMSASYVGAAALLSDLVDRGVDLAVQDVDGYTALMYAANAGVVEAVEILVEHGADVNQVDVSGSTPLMFAAQAGDSKIVKKLLAAGAVASTRNAAGASARDFAAGNGHERIAAMLQAAELR
jgi:hypothetical protein